MKTIKADVIMPQIYIETGTFEDNLSREEIENMLYDELIELLPSVNIKFLYEIEEG